MEPLLYLAHRIPYPPNKGDKIRSFNLLRHLAERYRVFLGCFVDSPDDARHVAELSRWSQDTCAIALDPRRARLRSLTGILSGEALTVAYYRNAALQAWVDRVIARESITRAVAFSSPMAQYLRRHPQLRTVVDLVDVDSAKWTSYADEHRWPLSSIYRREGERLLDFERQAVAGSAAGVLVTRAEVRLFNRLAPECAGRMHAIENGVDSDFFAPDAERASPFRDGEAPIVFTGVMDYWPNVDAVSWFARDVLPAVVRRRPDARFYIVGMNPSAPVRALASDPRVVVTGKVDDVRPYLQHAAAVVAPLRIARGVQNKILEAMAMGRAVVVTDIAAEGVAARPGVELETAKDAAAFAERTVAVMDAEHGRSMGARAFARIRSTYCWKRSVARFEELIEGAPTERERRAPPVCAGLAVTG